MRKTGYRTPSATLALLFLLSLLAACGSARAPSAPLTGKWRLWGKGTELRGANVYQRRVYPALDKNNFVGPGAFGPPYTQDDFKQLAALGANYVNISHAGLFTETAPFALDPAAQDNLDRLVAMAAKADVFAVISFRTGPGRSEFTFLLDQLGTYFTGSYLNDTVWGDKAAQDAWVAMWRYTAERYRNNPVIAGYDLMVEPNANKVGSNAVKSPLNVVDPAQFYKTYGGTLYDWNQLYPRIVAAIREVDSDTPILVGAMGYSAAPWLPYLNLTGDAHTVYAIHQYAPQHYTEQKAAATACTYPGSCDLNGDGKPDTFDRGWLSSYLAPVDSFKKQHRAPVAANEFGLMRWEPGAAQFMSDEMGEFERLGMNYAVWVWNPAWKPWNEQVDQFDFRHGPDPKNHVNVNNDLQAAIVRYWQRNTLRPSTLK